MTEEQIKQKADDYIIKRQNHIKYFSGEAVKILLKNFAEEIVTDAIKDLQKENAELKEKLKPENCIEYLAKGGYVKFLCENGNEHDQLTNAKDLLRKWIEPKYDREELLYLTEQFLNSEVEK